MWICPHCITQNLDASNLCDKCKTPISPLLAKEVAIRNAGLKRPNKAKAIIITPSREVETKKSFIQSGIGGLLGVKVSSLLDSEITWLVSIGLLTFAAFIVSLVREIPHPPALIPVTLAAIFALPWLLFACGRMGSKFMENFRLGYLDIFHYWDCGVGQPSPSIRDLPRWRRFWIVYRWAAVNGLSAGIGWGMVFLLVVIINIIINSPRFKG